MRFHATLRLYCLIGQFVKPFSVWKENSNVRIIVCSPETCTASAGFSRVCSLTDMYRALQEQHIMILSKGTSMKLIDNYRSFLKKFRVTKLFRALVEVGLIVAGSAGTAGAETVNDFQTLRQAVLDSGTSEIVFGNDIVLESQLQGTTAINRTLRIDGSGHTLRGAHPAFWFADMPSGSVSIENITFDGLKAASNDRYDNPVPFGPAIYFNMGDWTSEAVLNIGDGVTFRNNEAVADSAGGAVHVAHGIVNIGDNVNFKNNKSGAGGALYSESFTTIGDNVVFEGNEARRGGALDVIDDYEGYADDPDYLAGLRKVKYVHIGKNARFTNNTAAFWGTRGNGGAIEVQSGELVIDDGAVFSGNKSDGTAGALSIVDWSEEENTLPGKATLGTVSFEKNTATNGGAIFNEGDLRVNGAASFTSNTAGKFGGAIYNAGNLSLNGEASFTSNTAGKFGGAIYNAGNLSLNGTASFQKNTATEFGGAIFNESDLLVNGEASFEENSAKGAGGAIFNTSTGTTIFAAKAIFSKNTSDTGGVVLNEGELSFQSGAEFSANEASADGGTIYNTNVLTFGDGTVFANNTAEGDGGALYNDASASEGTIVSTGNIRFDGSASFTGNRATGHGGAIYNIYNVSLNPGTGDEILFRGNTDGTGKNAIHMASDSRLDMTGAGTVIFDDPISFADATPVVKKSGEGTLLFNADMNGFLGTIEIEGGTTRLTSDWNIKNAVTVRAGSLELPTFTFAEQDAATNVAGGMLTIAGGTLVTNTEQLFRNALGNNGSSPKTGGLKPSVAEHLAFTSGLITFNDAKYNLQYAGSAAATLGATYEGEQQGTKEITFTGELSAYVDPDPSPDIPPPQPDPDPVPGPSGTVSVGDLKDNHIDNVVLGNVTITTATDTEPEKGKNLIVGSDHVDNAEFSDAEALPGSIGGRNLNLGTEGSGVAIVGGHYLTLVGGSSDTSLIEAGNDKATPVNVHVGGMVDGQMSSGTLNLGTVAMPSGGVLRGNVQLGGTSVLNVRAGEHSITGESPHTGSQTVPGITNDGGTLNIAAPATLYATLKQTAGETNVAGTLTASSVELEGGQFNVSGTARIGQLEQQGGETIISGTAETASLEATDGTIRVTGILKADHLAASASTNITVGDTSAAGKLYAASVSLDGGSVFLDPVWQGNDTLEAASHSAMTFNTQGVDGQLTAGRNSLFVLGETSVDRTVNLFNASGLQWGQNGITAALAIQSPQHLDPAKGAVMVDGSFASASVVSPNTVTFGEGSLLMVNAAGLNGQAALTSQGGALKVAESASLLLGNVTAGDHLITQGFSDNTDVKGWEGNALSTPDQLIGLSLDKSEAGTVRVHATVLDAGTVLPDVALPNILDQVWSEGRNNTDSSNAGIAFLSRAVDKRYLAENDTVRTLNGAAQLAIAAGVQASTIQASDTVNRALQEHLSLTGTTGQPTAPALHREGADLWASMLYRDNDSSGIRAGSFSADYKNDFGGIIVGADYTWQNAGYGSLRAGGALNIGKGNGKSRGDFNYTRNDYNTYGLNAYGSWNRGNANLMADIGYMKGDNELKQSVPAALGGSLKADVDTQVWTVGARGEYRLRTAVLDVIPHVGARYLRVKTDAFNTRNHQGTVFHTDSDTQNIWQIPFGVTFSRNYVAENGWTVKPKLDVSFIPVTGDRDASTRIHVPGIGASDTTTTTIMDSTGWSGSLGLDIMKDRTRFGIRVGYQKSDDARSRGAMLTIGRQFD